MNRALYIGATSMVANQKQMDVISNNLANVNTTGFKRDISLQQSFPEVLLAKKSRIPTLSDEGARGFRLTQNDGVYYAGVNKGYFTMESVGGNGIFGKKSYHKEIKFGIDQEGYLKTFYRSANGLRHDYESYILDRNGNRIQVGADGNENLDLSSVLEEAVFDPMPYVIGTMSRGVRFQKAVTDFSPSSVRETGNKEDFALTDNGFFKVMDDRGEIYYTRSGSFGFSGGFLRDHDGKFVLVNGAPLEAPNDGIVNFDVMEDGKVYINDEYMGTVDVVNVENQEVLKKQGNNLYKPAERVDVSNRSLLEKRGYNPLSSLEVGDVDTNQPERAEVKETAYAGKVLQGYLEESNVNPVSSMVEMISLQRDYDAAQKIITTSDQMLEKSTELGRV